MIVVFEAVEILLCLWVAAAFVYDRKKEKRTASMEPAWLRPWLAAAIPFSHIVPEKALADPELDRMLGKLKPGRRIQEERQEYWIRRMAEGILVLTVTNALLIFLIGNAKQSEPRTELERPPFSEEAKGTSLIAETEDENASVTVWVPPMEPTPEEAARAMEEAVDKLRETVRVLSPVREAFSLPVTLGKVSVQYAATEEVWISSAGNVRWRKPVLKAGTRTIRAILTLGKLVREVELSIDVLPATEETFAAQVEEELAGAELTETTMVLPVTLDGTQELSFRTPDGQKGVGRYIFLLWCLPLAVVPLGKWKLKRKEKEKEKAVMLGYPSMLQKLTIYLSAGLSLQGAWERIALEGDKKDPLIEEMEVTRVRMKNGTPLAEALADFGKRINHPDIRKLVNMLCRDMRRGDEYILLRLQELNTFAWEAHKKSVRIQSEELETKLLFPMILMLAAILLLVLTPAMLTMQI